MNLHDALKSRATHAHAPSSLPKRPSTNGSQASHHTVYQSLPESLKPYAFHGMQLKYTSRENSATAECPFCTREDKFHINPNNGQWQCKVCNAGTDKGGGNIYTFIRLLHEESIKSTDTDQLEHLCKDRRLLTPNSLVQWGVVESMILSDWLIPGYNIEGKIVQLYKYALDRADNHWKLYATPGLGHGIHA